jgi:hypothetical protein
MAKPAKPAPQLRAHSEQPRPMWSWPLPLTFALRQRPRSKRNTEFGASYRYRSYMDLTFH